MEGKERLAILVVRGRLLGQPPSGEDRGERRAGVTH